MRSIGFLLVLFYATMLSSCTSSPAMCCECVVANSCWDSQICPLDPLGSCRWLIGDGNRPSYASDGWDVCYAVSIDCEATYCAEQCDGLTD